jgi:hypothetical protein
MLLLTLFLTQACNRYHVVTIDHKNEYSYYMEGHLVGDTNHIITFGPNTDWVFLDSTFVGDTVLIYQKNLDPVPGNSVKKIRRSIH